MVSFYKVWENLSDTEEADDTSPLLDSGDKTQSLIAIRNGLGLRRKEECGNFWDDFIKVCNNSQALSELLGVRPEQVSQWSSKIKEALDKVKDEDLTKEDRPKNIKTGNEGPVANPDGNYDAAQPDQTRLY